ncbi:hypothetical protein [Thermomonas brevis]
MASGVGAGTHVREIKAGICAAHPARGWQHAVAVCRATDGRRARRRGRAPVDPALLARSQAGRAGRGGAEHRLPGAPADTIPAG